MELVNLVALNPADNPDALRAVQRMETNYGLHAAKMHAMAEVDHLLNVMEKEAKDDETKKLQELVFNQQNDTGP